MAGFDDRKKAAETKFALDGEKEFKAQARRNKKLGLWLAEKMGVTGDAATAYAREVIASDFDEPGDEDVFRKVWGDVEKHKLDLSEHQVRRTMAELLEQARAEVAQE